MYHGLRLQLSDKMRNLPLNWFVQQGCAGVEHYVQQDINALHQLVAHAPADLVLSLLPPIGAFLCFRLMRSDRYRDIFSERDVTLCTLFEDYRTLAENPLVAQQFPGRGILRKTEQALLHFTSVFHHWVTKIGRPGAMAQVFLSSVLLTGWYLWQRALLRQPAHMMNC